MLHWTEDETWIKTLRQQQEEVSKTTDNANKITKNTAQCTLLEALICLYG